MSTRRRADARVWAHILVAIAGLLSSTACNFDSSAPPLVVAPDRPGTLSQQPAPTTLDETFEALSRGLSGTDVRSVQVLSEEDAIAATLLAGQVVQREWIEAADGALRGELTRLGFEPEDMAEAVLRTFWRRLHNRPLDLAGHVRRARAARALPSADRTTVFAEPSAKSLVEQCSRRVPGPVTGAWTPDAPSVALLEAVLAAALQEALDRRSPRLPDFRASEFYRQYGGLIIDGRRVIYVNGFHRHHIALTWSTGQVAPGWWRHIPVAVCDGGAWFFGAEYDVATERIISIEFNAGE